jgi:coenzyme F420 hydrogenase subunit beta
MRENTRCPCIGQFKYACLAKSQDRTLVSKGQTGGFVRSMLAYCLETGFARAALCVLDNPEKPLRPMAQIITTPQMAMNVSRSKYCPVPVNQLIAQVRETEGPFVFVGLSCHMQGLELATEVIQTLGSKIVLRIGLFCDRVLTYAAADYLVRIAGVHSEAVKTFDYRDKQWKGWPGDIRIKDDTGRIYNIPRNRRISAREFFTPIHCRLCPDKFNALSDLSVGDPHGLVTGTTVPSAVIVRSQIAHEILLQAEKAGKIHIEKADADLMIQGQRRDLNASRVFSFANEMRCRNFILPNYFTLKEFQSFKHHRFLKVRFLTALALFTDKPLGSRLIRKVPLWLPLGMAYFGKFIQLFPRAIRKVCKIPRSGE